MAEELDVPKVGKIKKEYVYATGAAVAGFVLWRYWHASKSAAAGAAPPPESAGTIGADIGSGAGGYYDPNAPMGQTTTVGSVLSTDQQWYEKAMLALSDAGYNTAAAAVALGKYLRTEPLTSAEQDMVKVALAAAGDPPSGKKAIVSTGDAPTPSGLGTPQNVRGNGSPTTASIPMQWDAVAGASSYAIYRGSTQLATVSGTSWTATGLAPGTQYEHAVRAMNTGGSMGPLSRAYVATTVKAPVPAPPKPAPKPVPKPPAIPPHYSVTVHHDDTMGGIAAKYHKSAKQVFDFNVRYRDKAAAATIKARGEDYIVAGETLWIPK